MLNPTYKVKLDPQIADWQWYLCPSLPSPKNACKLSLILSKSLIMMIVFVVKEIINKNNKVTTLLNTNKKHVSVVVESGNVW
jgi:hypothetical protein